jgi:hypothetical protein
MVLSCLRTLANFLLRAIAQLRACRPIPEAQVRELCHKARELLIEEGNVVKVTAPVTVRLSGRIRGVLLTRTVDLRRYPWAIPRFDGVIPGGW